MFRPGVEVGVGEKARARAEAEKLARKERRGSLDYR